VPEANPSRPAGRNAFDVLAEFFNFFKQCERLPDQPHIFGIGFPLYKKDKPVGLSMYSSTWLVSRGRVGPFDFSASAENRKLAPATSLKKLERMRSFFKFCEDRKWVNSNPAKVLKVSKVGLAPTLPFTQTEIEKIMWATEIFPNGERMKAFVMRDW